MTNQTFTSFTTEQYNHQLTLEKEMIDRGRERYFMNMERAKGRDAEATTSYGKIVLKRGIIPLAEAINTFIAEANTGKAGRKHKAVTLLKDMDSLTVAFITLRTILDKVSRMNSAQSLAVNIAHEVELEKKLMHLEEEDNDRFLMTQRHIHSSKTASYRKAVLKFAFGKSMTVDFEPWSSADALHLGMKLIELTGKATGILQLILKHKATATKKDYPSYQIEMMPSFLTWIESHKEHASLLSPDYIPTIIPPAPWQGASGGGYYSLHHRPLTLVKVPDRDYLASLDTRIQAGEMKGVLSAVNALQNTAWTVNERILEVANTLWDNADDGVAGLPPRDFIPLPRCPVCGADITDSASSVASLK